MKEKVMITAVHEGQLKTKPIFAWSRILNVSEHFLRVRKITLNKPDQKIIDEAVKLGSTSLKDAELRKKYASRKLLA